MGVDDVRKMEHQWQREREAGQARIDEIARTLCNIRAEVSMLEQTLAEGNKKPEELMPKMQAEIDHFSQKLEVITKDSGSLGEEFDRQECRVRECAVRERNCETVVSRLRQGKEKRQELMSLEKRVADLDIEDRKLGDTRTDILRQSVLEDIEVPLLRGSFEALQDIAEAPSQAPDA